MRVQVVIVGAGPAGLFLGHTLHAAGVDCLILERHDRAYVEGRVRAGVLERTTVSLMESLGVAARMRAEGLVHEGTWLASDGDLFRIDFADLTGGASVMVYGQQEVMRDLFEAARERGLEIVFEASEVALHDAAGGAPSVTWSSEGKTHRAACDFIAGCDGFHGISRASVPGDAIRLFERVYPFGWLGILVDQPPCNHELIYSNHESGFALASMRSPTRSRYYIQCSQDARVDDWPDERFWNELCVRLGPAACGVRRGASFEKTIAPLRSLVAEPMRHGRLFLAGDAAHIVPPTGAKGMNLAVSDVIMLAEGIIDHYRSGSDETLERYSARALSRVWKAERFSWWFTGLTHRFPESSPFDRRIQLAELSYLKSSRAAQTAFAENYVGLPIEPLH